MAALAALVAMLADAVSTRPPLEPVLRIRETTEYYGVFARNEAELLQRHRQNVIHAARSMRDEIAGLPFHARCEQADATMKQVVDSAEMKRRFADQFVDQRRVLPLSWRDGG